MDIRIADIARQLDEFLQPEQDPRQARKRERILAAAVERFTAYGYRKTSVEDVANAAGVAKGTVYLYYRSKPELLLHAVAWEKRTYLTRLEPLWQRDMPAADRLRELIALGLVMKQKMPLVTRLTGGDHELALAMQEVDVAVLQDISELQMQVVVALLDAATGEELPRAELEARGRVLIDAIFAVMTSEPMMPTTMPLDDYARRMAALLVSGVTAPLPAANAAATRAAGAT
jgi:AcrR family transcriptional regulator